MRITKLGTVFIFIFFFGGVIFANTPIDTIINLKEIVVKPHIFNIIQPKTKRSAIKLSGKINCSIVSSVQINKDKTYRIYGVEFYFNPHTKGIVNNGFYVKPLLLFAKNGKPSTNILDNKTTYYIDKKINTKFLFDLSNYNIVLEDLNLFFVGLSFPDINESKDLYTFNIKMKESKNKNYFTFIRHNCEECPYTQFYLSNKKTRTLDYKVYYTEVIE